MQVIIDVDKDDYKKAIALITAAYAVKNKMKDTPDEPAPQENKAEEEKPAKPAKAKADKPKKQKASDIINSDEKQLTFEDLVKFIADINEKYDFSTALALIKKHGAAKLSDIKPAGYAAFAADAEKILNK